MNANDDDRTARSQVTLRLDRDLLDRIDDLARDEGVDRTELVRRLLADGLAGRRMEAAIGQYAAGRRSAWSASEYSPPSTWGSIQASRLAAKPTSVSRTGLPKRREALASRSTTCRAPLAISGRPAPGAAASGK